MWYPKYRLSQDIINAINNLFSVLGQPYIIDEAPSYHSNWESTSRETFSFCWLFESIQFERDSLIFCESQPLWEKLGQVRKVLDSFSDPAFSYIASKRSWGKYGMSYIDCLVIAPTNNQLDAVLIEETGDSTCDLDTPDVVVQLKLLDKLFGIDILAVYEGWVEIQLKTIPEESELEMIRTYLQDRLTRTYFNKAHIELSNEDLKNPFMIGCYIDD